MSAIETTGVPAPARRMRSYANSRWAALPVLMAGTFMIVMDFFIVNVAFPSIQADLHASGSAIEWVVAGYGLTYASFLITAGASATTSDGAAFWPSACCCSCFPRSRAAWPRVQPHWLPPASCRDWPPP